MTVSYVVATVATVLFVEGVAGALVLPRVLTGQDVTVRALDAAQLRAKELGRAGAAPGAALSAGAPPDKVAAVEAARAAGLPTLDAKDGSTTGSGKLGTPWSRRHCAAVWISCVTEAGVVVWDPLLAAPAAATWGVDAEPPHAASAPTDTTSGRATLNSRVMVRR